MTDRGFTIGIVILLSSLFILGAVATYFAYRAPNEPIPSSDTFLDFSDFPVATTTSTETEVLGTTTEATTTPPTMPAPKESQKPIPVYKSAIATVFWIGEEGDASNGYIPNAQSAFDRQWMEHYGGYDDPECRKGFLPCGFTPKENPFYVALPYTDLAELGKHKDNAARIPWYAGSALELSRGQSIVKNHWVEVKRKDAICYAQWEDVGPFETDDIEYVFGSAPLPKNTLGVRAGIDLSPALRDCLKVGDVSTVEWRFVSVGEVPDGPWSKVVTTRH